MTPQERLLKIADKIDRIPYGWAGMIAAEIRQIAWEV